MNNKNNLTEAAISNFKDIVSLMESNRTTVEGEVYVGSKFLVTIGCNPFFQTDNRRAKPCLHECGTCSYHKKWMV